jgi:hypothetical protein
VKRTFSRIAAPLLLVATLLIAQHATASAQGAGEIAGNIPHAGGYAIVVWGGGTPDTLVVAATAKGCSPASIWITSEGQFVPFIVGAPAFVNATFVDRWPGGSIPGGTPIIIVCKGA